MWGGGDRFPLAMEGGAGAPTPEGWLALRVHVPELNLHKDLHFPRDQLVWDVKQQCLAALPKVTISILNEQTNKKTQLLNKLIPQTNSSYKLIVQTILSYKQT